MKLGQIIILCWQILIKWTEFNFDIEILPDDFLYTLFNRGCKSSVLTFIEEKKPLLIYLWWWKNRVGVILPYWKTIIHEWVPVDSWFLSIVKKRNWLVGARMCFRLGASHLNYTLVRLSWLYNRFRVAPLKIWFQNSCHLIGMVLAHTQGWIRPDMQDYKGRC